MALSRDQIVTAALDILRAEGLAGLTLRKLGCRLGVSAPTLYWHVKDKRELLDLMVERIMADGREARLVERPARATEWWQKLADIMRSQYRMLISVRDAPLIMAGNRPTEATLPWIERMLALWQEAGFPPEEALGAILALGNFVLGSALEYQAEEDRARGRSPEAHGRPDLAAYPHLAAAASGRRLRDPHATFEHGLALIIAGLRQRQAELAAEEAQA